MKSNIQSFLKSKDFKILALILIAGFVLRFINLTDNINFHYDQGRDALRIYNMVHDGDFKIVGPETDIPGVFNGPFYYYLLLPLYAVSNFNPNFVAGAFILFNLAGGVLLYAIARTLFEHKQIGLIAAFLWTISFEQAVFSRYISNASLMSLTTMIFFLGLGLLIFRNKQIGLTISVVGYALAVHSNFYLIYLGGFYPLLYLLYRPKLEKKNLIVSLGIFLALISNYILTELLWGFPMVQAFIAYFGEQRVHTTNIYGHLELYFDKLFEMIYFSFISWDNRIILILIPIFIWLGYRENKKRKAFIFLLIWFFSTAPLFIFRSGVLTVPVISTSIFGAATLLVAMGLYQMYVSRLRIISLILIFTIVSTNIAFGVRSQFKFIEILSAIPFPLSDSKAAVEYTYNASLGEPFSICAITNPLFTNATLSIVYTVYGKSKYGYYPFWSGQPQILNKSLFPNETEPVLHRYLLIEPPVGVPLEAVQATIYSEDLVSRIIEEKKFGAMTVQKRVLNIDLEDKYDSQGLTKHEDDLARMRLEADPRYSCFNIYSK